VMRSYWDEIKVSSLLAVFACLPGGESRWGILSFEEGPVNKFNGPRESSPVSSASWRPL
jgi:hypothetical protein